MYFCRWCDMIFGTYFINLIVSNEVNFDIHFNFAYLQEYRNLSKTEQCINGGWFFTCFVIIVCMWFICICASNRRKCYFGKCHLVNSVHHRQSKSAVNPSLLNIEPDIDFWIVILFAHLESVQNVEPNTYTSYRYIEECDFFLNPIRMWFFRRVTIIYQ